MHINKFFIKQIKLLEKPSKYFFTKLYKFNINLDLIGIILCEIFGQIHEIFISFY